MCGRYTLVHPERAVDRFGFVDFHDLRLPPRFNVSPSQWVPVVAPGEAGPEVRLMQWGFRPAWLRQPKGPPPINARAETIAESRMFVGSLRRLRCLVLADGFYEWAPASSGSRGRKQPMYIRLKQGELFGFAGIYANDPDDNQNCALVTTGANELMQPIHNRMPVILDPDAAEAWLDPRLDRPADLAGLLQPYSAERMEAYPVQETLDLRELDEDPELARRALRLDPEPPTS